MSPGGLQQPIPTSPYPLLWRTTAVVSQTEVSRELGNGQKYKEWHFRFKGVKKPCITVFLTPTRHTKNAGCRADAQDLCREMSVLFARPLGGWPWGPLEKAARIQPADAKAMPENRVRNPCLSN